MQAHDVHGSGPGMAGLARSLGWLIYGDRRLSERGVVAVDDGEVELFGDVEPWIDVPKAPPTLAIGELDSPLAWLPSAVDLPDRDVMTYPIYGRLTFGFVNPR